MQRVKKIEDMRNVVSQKCILISSLLISIIWCIALVIALVYVMALHNNFFDNCKSGINNITKQNMYLHAAVSSDAGPCSNIANNIMMVKGGNAVDGAIAGIICDCSVNFHSCGIGGGAFVVIYIKKEGKAYAIDLREQAPASAYEAMFVNDTEASLIGGKSIAVMGMISGFYEIHQRLGRIHWETLFEQTIDLLNTGFFISKTIENAIKYFEKSGNKTMFKELWSIISNKSTGLSKKFGDIIKIPKLSTTLRILALEPHAMRNGSLVNKIIKEIKSAGGIITENDLAQYEVKWRTPVSVRLNPDNFLYTMPPPSSGALIAFILNVLSEYPFDFSYLNSCKKAGLFFHRFVETLKFAYAKRSALGDMDFINVTNIIANLTSDNYAKWIKYIITDYKTQDVSYYQPSFQIKEDHGTSHFNLVSPEGDAVSVTSTINFLFGSLVMGEETGIVYNNEMDDFSSPNEPNVYGFPPSPSNFVKPKKRPMSSMSPIIIVSKSGDVKLLTGASGGSKIISSTALVASLTTLLNQEIKKSIDYPRIHHQLIPNKVIVEQSFPKGIINELKKRGHIIKYSKNVGIVQGIHRSEQDSSYIECNSDFRKMGQCDGH